MSERKILLFDLDGTLLKNDKTLSERTLKVLAECRNMGHLIGVATSRSEVNCMGFLREISPDIVISSGGASVRVKGEIIRSCYFSAEETKCFIEKAREICGGDCEITADTSDAHYWNYKTNPKEQDKSWSESVYTDFKDFERETLKICVLIPSPDRACELRDNFPDLDCRRFSDGDWYKFTKGGATKENAIESVCENLDFSLSNVIAFGDDYSDIGMLKMCGKGVAMGNGIEDVKKIADDTTLSNEEDGAAVYLEKNLLKRTEVKFYDHVSDEKLRFAVIAAESRGKFVFCKHRDRQTWEIPGGHREPHEDIADTARRELYEETGAVEFDIKPVCVYSVISSENSEVRETFGMLFYADIYSFENELHSEIEKIILADKFPENPTYPLIQPRLLEEAKRRGSAK